MTNAQTPPYGWRLVDTVNDDPKRFPRQMMWSTIRKKWEAVAHYSLNAPWHEDETWAVPIDPGPHHRLIDPAVDRPEFHPDAEWWDDSEHKWEGRILRAIRWKPGLTYRTPTKSPATGDGWKVGEPTEDEVGDHQDCLVTTARGAVVVLRGHLARAGNDHVSPDRTIAWKHIELPPPYVPPKEPEPGEFWRQKTKSLAAVRIVGHTARGVVVMEGKGGGVGTFSPDYFAGNYHHLPGVTSFDEAEGVR